MNKTKAKRYLFIEGTSNEENGKLSQGFHKLLRQKLAGKMPRIKMADSKEQAIRTFKKSQFSDNKYLLVDLDAPEDEKEKDLKDKQLNDEAERVFFMIQEMEAWFLSQPNILDEFYKSKLSDKIPRRQAKEIPDPSDVLRGLTKSTKKGAFHKVEHGTALLEMLDAGNLEFQFEDFADLINRLS
jgi:Domain of unknown function (DUF4276)